MIQMNGRTLIEKQHCSYSTYTGFSYYGSDRGGGRATYLAFFEATFILTFDGASPQSFLKKSSLRTFQTSRKSTTFLQTSENLARDCHTGEMAP